MRSYSISLWLHWRCVWNKFVNAFQLKNIQILSEWETVWKGPRYYKLLTLMLCILLLRSSTVFSSLSEELISSSSLFQCWFRRTQHSPVRRSYSSQSRNSFWAIRKSACTSSVTDRCLKTNKTDINTHIGPDKMFCPLFASQFLLVNQFVCMIHYSTKPSNEQTHLRQTEK